MLSRVRRDCCAPNRSQRYRGPGLLTPSLELGETGDILANVGGHSACRGASSCPLGPAALPPWGAGSGPWPTERQCLLHGWAELGVGKVRGAGASAPGLALLSAGRLGVLRQAADRAFRRADPCLAGPGLPPGLCYWVMATASTADRAAGLAGSRPAAAWRPSPISRAAQCPVALLGSKTGSAWGRLAACVPHSLSQSPCGHKALQGRMRLRSLTVGHRVESVLKGQEAAVWSLQQAPQWARGETSFCFVFSTPRDM